MSTPVKLALVAAFAIAMANVEAAVVAYLREIYGIEDLVRDVPRQIDRSMLIEISREAATMVMLLTVGLLGFAVMSWAGLRVTWPAESRVLRTAVEQSAPAELAGS